MLNRSATETDERLAAGYAAIEAGRWPEARDLFAAALASRRQAETLEAVALAAWFLHDEKTVFETREEAYKLYREKGDPLGAARMALWLSDDALSFRGETAISNGWMGRARNLLDGLALAREHGWMNFFEADHALMLTNDGETTRVKAGKAVEIGRQTGDLSLEMLALSLQGLCLLTGGAVEAGMGNLDEAATACLAGDVREAWIATTIFCYMLDGCDRVRDFERASQWFRNIDQLNARWNARELYAFCRPHYAVVLTWRGDWLEAENQLRISIDDLTEMRPPMAVEGIVRLAELRWRQGRWDEAEALFEKTKLEPLSQLGQAMLALDRGDPTAALDLVERCLRRLPPHDRLERMPALEVQVRCLLALGELERAQAVLPELDQIATAVRTKPVRASAAVANGLVASQQGDFESARRCFEDAADLYEASCAPFEMGEARCELARTLLGIGRVADAMREGHLALETFQKLGARRKIEKATKLVAAIAGASGKPVSEVESMSGLTRREAEVLHLLSTGLSNQEIAGSLVISVRTVERHVSTIYDKLALSGRSARASAAAYVFGLRSPSD